MSHVETATAFLDLHAERSGHDVIASLTIGDGRTVELTQPQLRAIVAELEQLRADNAALLDGNQRLQTMNEGLRQMAIEAREAANSWQQATIDLYSGREEPHPADCSCGRQEAESAPQQPEHDAADGGADRG